MTPALQDVIAEAIGPTACDATAHSVKLPPGLLQPAQQPDSMGRLAHYEILSEVGSGGMGIVLKAFDTSLRRVVAIKVMAPHLAANAAARRRFVREAQAAAAVAHEHVVAIHAVADQHDPPYLAMQFIEGKTLQERLDKSGPLSVREVLRIGMQTAAGLAAAHAQGLVHRDIKPANILLENGVERVKLTDFGLARAVDDASVTQSGVIAGTPLFMSPEQARGESIDHRSDLFSLGSVMYAMCVGHAPFRASTTMGVIKRVCDESPRPIRELNPDVPDWLVTIIDKLLAKNPADRIQSAQEVADLLGQCLAHLQQPQTIPLPITAATLPQAVTQNSAPALRPLAQEKFAVKVLTIPAFGLFGLFVVIVSIGKMPWHEFLIASCVLGLWVLFVRSIATARRSLVWTAAQTVEVTRPDAKPAPSQSRSMRIRVGFVLGLVAGSLSMAWLIGRNMQPTVSPAGAWWEFVGELALWLFAGGSLVTGILVGGRRFVRGLDTTNPGGRLWGTAISGVLLAIVCAGLLMVGGFAAVYRTSYSPQQVATARLTYQLPGPRVAVTLNGKNMDVSPSGEIHLNLTPGEYIIVYIKHGRPEVRSGETFASGQQKTVRLDETQADAVQISGPLIRAYGPGASAPSVVDYILLQGRWAITSQERNSVLSTESQRSRWIEFDRGYLRSDLPDTPRSLPFLSESLVALYSHETPAQIDVLNNGAKGIYKLEKDTLTLAIADPKGPRPTEFVSKPGSGITVTICQRVGGAVSLPTSDGRPFGTQAAAELAKSGWFLGSDGPELTDVFGKIVLKLQPVQIEKVNNILRTIHQEARTLEAQQIERQTNAAGHLVIRIKPYPELIEKLKDQLWTQLDAVLNAEQQSIARLNLKLDPPEVRPPIALTELVAPGFFGWSQHGATLELWRVGTWHHWKMQTRGYESSGNARQLPDEYRRFWIEPAEHLELVQTLPVGSQVDRLLPAGDGREFIGVGSEETKNGLVKFWNTGTLEEMRTWRSEQPLRAIAFVPQANRLLTVEGESRNGFFVRDAKSFELVTSFANHSVAVTSLAASPDGRWLASGDSAGSVILWQFDLQKNEGTPKTLSGHSQEVTTLAFSPDGSLLASGSLDKTVRIFDVASGQLKHMLDRTNDRVTEVRFSDDGQLLAVASWDRLIWILDPVAGNWIGSLRDPTEKANSVALSPDKSLVAAGCFDGSLLVFDRAKGNIVARTDAQQSEVGGVTFLDNERIASAHRNGFVGVWRLRP